jgi:hypothetical protein
VITFGSDKRFGIVHVQRKDSEGNTAERRKWEARGRCHQYEARIFCQCPQYSSNKLMDFALELLQSAMCSCLINTLRENGC